MFPTAEGGHECPLASGVLTQTLLQHVDQCMRHEDVVKTVMLAQLARKLTEWQCKTFHLKKLALVLVSEKMSWATATQSIGSTQLELRRLRDRV